jgi:hypothetical protein
MPAVLPTLANAIIAPVPQALIASNSAGNPFAVLEPFF